MHIPRIPIIWHRRGPLYRGSQCAPAQLRITDLLRRRRRALAADIEYMVRRTYSASAPSAALAADLRRRAEIGADADRIYATLAAARYSLRSDVRWPWLDWAPGRPRELRERERDLVTIGALYETRYDSSHCTVTQAMIHGLAYHATESRAVPTARDVLLLLDIAAVLDATPDRPGRYAPPVAWPDRVPLRDGGSIDAAVYLRTALRAGTAHPESLCPEA